MKLSTPRTKQLNLALHSRRFRSYPSTSSYMEGLLAVPYGEPLSEWPVDSRAKGVSEAVAAAALSDLNQLAN
jgi:hypothetical protein